MNIVVTKGNKSLEISFRQKLWLGARYIFDPTNDLYVVSAFGKGLEPDQPSWALACPSKDGHPLDRVYNGEEINLFRPDRLGRIDPDSKIRVKLEKSK